ncbi:MAG: S-layer homology domain-containing protein [Clostridia bacterium]|nr:S-layer homology domain-containing protein [Clostridia bacterium]
MKRILSVLLTVALLFSSVPMVVMADMPNDFQANFNVDALDGKWNTKEDGSGDSCDTVRLDFQVKGTNVSRNQGAWIAIDLTQLVWVDYTEDGYTIFDSENITIVPGATAVKFFEGDEPYYYDLKDPVKSGRNTVDMWSIGETAPILVAVSADSNTMYLCPQPSQSYEVTYEALTTIVSFRLAVCPGVELSSDAIRFINAEEREHLNQSFIVLMADKTNMFGYGFAPDKETGVTPADTLAIPSAFTGTAGVTGKPTVKPVDAVKPVIDVAPAGASYIVGTAATPLTVSATVTDGGTITYEWFKNDTNSTENGTSVGTGAAYTPATDVIGETYYYVVVTNTNENATGAKTASVTGDAVKITVTADPDLEALAAAKQTLETTGIGSVNQKDCPSEDDIKAYIVSQLRGLVPGFELTVNTVKYTPSVPGTSAVPMGTNGEYQYTVTIEKNGKTTTTAELKADVLAVAYEGITDEQAIAAAESALKAITWAEIAQAVANTQDTVQAKLLEQARAAINNDRVTVTVEVTAFTAAVAGSAATTKEGTNGSATFTVTATIGTEEYKLENQSVVIKATAFDGKLDSEVIAEAEAALKAITWAEIAQAVANTQDTVQAKLLEQAKAAINNDRVTVTVEVTAFTAAVAGSAATTKEGTNGSATFTVTATIGTEEYKLENQNVVIKATAFDGVLDVDAVAAAKKALVDSKVIVKIGATASEIRTAVENYLKSLMKGDAKGVTVTITAVDGDQYTVALAKGSVTAEKTITITVEEEDPIKLREPANLQFTDGVAIWTPVENAVSYTVSLYEVVDGVETLITTVAALNSQCDFSEILEEGKSYVFDVIAHGDGVYFLDSDVSDFSAVYTEGNTWEQILVVLLAIRNSKYPITATAGEGGAITDAGVTKVKYGRDMTYYIAAEPGYEIDQVIVDGKDVGPVSEYTFTDVKKKHTISVTFKAAAWKNPFKDVSEGDPFCDAVQFVYENKLFQGISDTEFAPAMTMTRAMFVTVLWRLEGMPVVNYLMQYEDVEAETWYTEAIRWATAEGIVEGYGDGIFGTNDPVTVQQSAVIMARYAEYTGNYTAPGANLGIYADNADVADWAVEAMMWAVENGVYAPVNGKLVPTALAPRSLAAQLMHAYVVKFGK